MSRLKSPLPTPRFFEEAEQLSTKKARAGTRDHAPPKPPVKTATSIGRFYQNRLVSQKAQAVSFRNLESSTLSKCYDESRHELYFNQCFHVISVLGEGSFGKVFKVRSKEDGKFYAVKRSREPFKGESDRLYKLEEVKKHEQLPKHRNCVKFFKAWEERHHLYIQTELCDTSLGHFADQNHEIPERLIWKYLVDLLMAVKHLHDHELLHLDIKPANIFIAQTGICKLGDFGLMIDATKSNISEAQEGDAKYLAPELMQGQFSKAADIFSLGITMLELACDLDLPRGGDAWHQLRHGAIPRDFIQHLSPELISIIRLMMLPNYKERPSAQAILQHPSVYQVVHWRKLEVLIKSLVYRICHFFGLFLTAFTFIWFVICWFWKRFLPSNLTASSKCTPKRALFDDECSLSDDEEYSLDKFNSGIADLKGVLDFSSSGESHNGSFSVHGSEHIVNSTPTCPRPQGVRANGISPQLNTSFIYDSFMHSPTQCDKTFHEFDFVMDNEISKISLGPKNLLDVFDTVSDNED